MAIHCRGDGAVVEGIMRPTHELADRQVVRRHELVHRSGVRAGGLQIAGDIEKRVGRVPVADELALVKIPQDFHFDDESHVHNHVRTFLVRLVELGERGEERIVVRVGHRDVGDLGQDIFGNPLVDLAHDWATADEPGDLGTALVIDEGAD